MDVSLVVGPPPQDGESAHDAYARLDGPGAAAGPITPVMQAFIERVRTRVGAPDDSWLDGDGSLRSAVAGNHAHLSISADEDLADRISAVVREVSAELQLMVHDPAGMRAWLPGQDAPVDGRPPTEGPYGPFDQIEVFVSAEPPDGRPAYQLYDDWCRERWSGSGEEPDPDERILALIAAVREGLTVPEESYTADRASLLHYVHGTALDLRLYDTGGLRRWEEIFAVVRREAQTLGLLYYDPVRQVALMPGESELVPCERPEPDPATWEPMPEPLTAERYHREATADLMAHIGVVDPAPGWPHHLQDAPVKSVLDQLDAGDHGRYFSPMVRVRVTDGTTGDPVQARIDAWRCGADGAFDDRTETPWELQNRGWTRADGDGVWGLVTWLHRRGADPDLEDERSWIHVGVRAPGHHSEYRRVLLLDPEAPADVDVDLPDTLPDRIDDVAQTVDIVLRRRESPDPDF